MVGGGRVNAEPLAAAVARVEAAYAARNTGSRARFERARGLMPGGSTRTVLHYDPFPLTFVRGAGATLEDADGHVLLDYLGEYTAGLYGHSHPVLQQALATAIAEGLSLGGLNRFEAELAAALRARFPSCELVRFCNSGTEANLMAITAARIATGRPEVLVMDGAYHGGVLAFATRAAAVTAPFPWRYGRFNDLETTAAALADRPEQVAAVIVEPMMGGAGVIPAEPGFLAGLRELTRHHGCVLILDEVMTSRHGAGGLQGRHGVRPDLTTFGKYLGGGASFGAFGGRADVMAIFDATRPDGIAHAGTFNNNTLSMAAGLAGLTGVFTPEVAEAFFGRGERLASRLRALAAARAAPLVVSGAGSMIGLHVQAVPVRRPEDVLGHADARKLLHLALLERGVSIGRRGFVALSLPLTDADDDRFVAALDDVLTTFGPALQEAVSA
jgi:glutamate-1-semialdehyde 2,1-aminomutase